MTKYTLSDGICTKTNCAVEMPSGSAPAYWDCTGNSTPSNGNVTELGVSTSQKCRRITADTPANAGYWITVPPQNKLNAVTEEAPYYWRVRAVDKALNEGEWSETATFYVGFGMNMPQAVIYVIIVGVALLLAVFTFWLGRKTAYY